MKRTGFFLTATMAALMALVPGCSSEDNGGETPAQESGQTAAVDNESEELKAFLSELEGTYALYEDSYNSWYQNTSRSDKCRAAFRFYRSDRDSKDGYGYLTMESWTMGTIEYNENNEEIAYVYNKTIWTKNFVKLDSGDFSYYFSIGVLGGNGGAGVTINSDGSLTTTLPYTNLRSLDDFENADDDKISFHTHTLERMPESFDFYDGTSKEEASSSESGSVPSDFSLSGTTWTYTGTAGKTTITYTVTFASDGSFAVAKSGKSQATGTWSLDGSTLKVAAKNTSGTEAEDSFALSGDSSSLTLTLSGESSYTTSGSSYTTADYAMSLSVMFMLNAKTATLSAQ